MSGILVLGSVILLTLSVVAISVVTMVLIAGRIWERREAARVVRIAEALLRNRPRVA